MIFLFVLLLLAAFTACGSDKQTGPDPSDAGNSGGKADVIHDSENGDGTDISKDPSIKNPDDTNLPDVTGSEPNTGENTAEQKDTSEKSELLQSASVDLDADGINEQIKAVKVTIADTDKDAAGRYEGRLEIHDGDSIKEVVFWRKDEDLSGMMSSLQFEDMDGDGAKDIIVIIPGYGASFTYSNCFAYSYAKDRSCIFISDNELADFIGGFRFEYESGSGSKLKIINDLHGFSAILAIEGNADIASLDEVMFEYAQRSWIDPTSVDISESSKLALINNRGKAEIKVPLPIFGMATVNMIGELDLYYSINNYFDLVLERYEIIDFEADKKIKAGTFTVRK